MPRRRQDDDDDVSDLGEDETAADRRSHKGEEQPRFKYSTEHMEQNTRWNNNCLYAAMAVVCIVVAIVITVLVTQIGKSNDNSDSVNNPTPSPTRAPGAPPAAGADGFKSVETYINGICSGSNYLSNPETCAAQCSEFDCCSPTIAVEKESCLFNNRNGCLRYAKCHVNKQVFDPASTEIENICAPLKLQTDRKPCEDACAASECCWNADDPDMKGCVSTNFFGCLDFAPCQNLRSSYKVPVPSLRLSAVCSKSSAAYHQETCDDTCGAASCCSLSSPDTCFFTDMIACMHYEPICGNVPNPLPIAGTVVKVPDEPIRDVCSSTNFATNPQACETACIPSACCRNSTCVDTDPLGCLQYERCFDLFP